MKEESPNEKVHLELPKGSSYSSAKALFRRFLVCLSYEMSMRMADALAVHTRSGLINVPGLYVLVLGDLIILNDRECCDRMSMLKMSRQDQLCPWS